MRTEGKTEPRLRPSVQRKIKQRNKCWKDYKMSLTEKNCFVQKKRNEVNQVMKTERDNKRKGLSRNCKRNPKKFYRFMRKLAYG